MNSVVLYRPAFLHTMYKHAIVDIHHMYDARKESDFLDAALSSTNQNIQNSVRGVKEPTAGGPASHPFIVVIVPSR